MCKAAPQSIMHLFKDTHLCHINCSSRNFCFLGKRAKTTQSDLKKKIPFLTSSSLSWYRYSNGSCPFVSLSWPKVGNTGDPRVRVQHHHGPPGVVQGSWDPLPISQAPSGRTRAGFQEWAKQFYFPCCGKSRQLSGGTGKQETPLPALSEPSPPFSTQSTGATCPIPKRCFLNRRSP